MRNSFTCSWRLLVGGGLLLVGCSTAPSGIAPPTLDPVAAADRAFSEYDSNGDQELSRDEVKTCPGLMSALDRFDRDGNGSISIDELKSKLEEIKQQGAALVEVSCEVKKNHQPLEGATVKFMPESFLGDAILPATGITGRDGLTFPSVPDEALPEEYRGRLHGVHCGVYRVLVTHPNVAVPSKYNSETELGRIVTRRDHDTLTIDF